jgi:hypothetical protein
MAYIGKQPTVGNFIKLDAITTSATATYNLLNGGVAYSPQSPNHCIVSLNGVIQSPTTSFTISGSTIVFASALTATDVIDFILVLGDVLNIGTPSDATVGFSKVTSNLITGATAETSIDGGDSVLIYDDSASALRKMTRTNFVAGVGGTNTPLISASHTSSVSIPNNTTTRLPLNSATFDASGWYDSTNTRITVPSGTASGKVLIIWQTTQSNNAGNNCGAFLFKNASAIQENLMFYTGNNSEILTSTGAFITSYAAGDYFNIYAFTDGSGTFSSSTGTGTSFLHMFKLVE